MQWFCDACFFVVIMIKEIFQPVASDVRLCMECGPYITGFLKWHLVNIRGDSLGIYFEFGNVWSDSNRLRFKMVCFRFDVEGYCWD